MPMLLRKSVAGMAVVAAARPPAGSRQDDLVEDLLIEVLRSPAAPAG